ncbi:MAG TPA: CBS domain-containing protein [Lacunisphaera sp.]|nr:CBS domain-containing protein [Lacunisphaera sp.]
MKVRDVMTPHARCIGPDSTLVEAAEQMGELDVGSLPICSNDRLAGIVTDRDLALRGITGERDARTTRVREVMSPGIVYVFDDQDVEEAARLMEVKQIRRLPVLNREKRLVGIVSLGDLAVDAGMALSGEALREISRPVHHESQSV